MRERPSQRPRKSYVSERKTAVHNASSYLYTFLIIGSITSILIGLFLSIRRIHNIQSEVWKKKSSDSRIQNLDYDYRSRRYGFDLPRWSYIRHTLQEIYKKLGSSLELTRQLTHYNAAYSHLHRIHCSLRHHRGGHSCSCTWSYAIGDPGPRLPLRWLQPRVRDPWFRKRILQPWVTTSLCSMIIKYLRYYTCLGLTCVCSAKWAIMQTASWRGR